MSQPEREAVQSSQASQVPPAGEEIHIPAPTALPLFTAVGITLTLIGITTFIELTIIGGILTIYCVARWIRDAREEYHHLPPEQ
jgi:hypothetical protein